MQVLLISDVHANHAALEAVLGSAPAIEAIWNLGDSVGYGPRPGACLDLLMKHATHPILSGNHDLAAIGALDLSTFNDNARRAAIWTASQLTPEQQARIARLPMKTIERGYTLAHASPREPVWEYVTDAATATANFSAFTTDTCFIGHSHIALVAHLKPETDVAVIQRFTPGTTIDLASGRFLINPGSVGQPRDGDPRAAFALLDTGKGTVTSQRIDYDVTATQRQMLENGLPQSLIARLSIGR